MDREIGELFPLSAIPSLELRMEMSNLMVDSLLLQVDGALSRILNLIDIQRIISLGPRIFGVGLDFNDLEKLPLDSKILEGIADSSAEALHSNDEAHDDASSLPKAGDVRDLILCDCCSICLSTFRDIFERSTTEDSEQGGGSKPVYICRLPCNHLFCLECLRPWLVENESCPNCRLGLEDIQNLYQTMAEKAPAWWVSALTIFKEKEKNATPIPSVLGNSPKVSVIGSDTDLSNDPGVEEISIRSLSSTSLSSTAEVVAISPLAVERSDSDGDASVTQHETTEDSSSGVVSISARERFLARRNLPYRRSVIPSSVRSPSMSSRRASEDGARRGGAFVISGPPVGAVLGRVDTPFTLPEGALEDGLNEPDPHEPPLRLRDLSTQTSSRVSDAGESTSGAVLPAPRPSAWGGGEAP
ncbi:unnamed protein product [Phytomonas sp. EM1]|nr:unnamed protein product [Phytomonas sp. EM1]|eukprot:CCW64815.1 unnamed protein product [Phytomonas sp. isolate EM1]